MTSTPKAIAKKRVKAHAILYPITEITRRAAYFTYRTEDDFKTKVEQIKTLEPCMVCAIGALIQQLPKLLFNKAMVEIVACGRNQVGISSPNLSETVTGLKKTYGVTLDELMMLQAANDFVLSRAQLKRRVEMLLSEPVA